MEPKLLSRLALAAGRSGGRAVFSDDKAKVSRLPIFTKQLFENLARA
jgi:hypothetical protein